MPPLELHQVVLESKHILQTVGLPYAVAENQAGPKTYISKVIIAYDQVV